jgi:polyphosphate glucokinase
MTKKKSIVPREIVSSEIHTLAIDIGGTGLKASVLDPQGNMVVDELRVPTPYPCPPKILIAALVELVAPLPSFDRISVGFPGVVRGGIILTAPHFGNNAWDRFPLATVLLERLGKPVRLLNDAEIQGLGVIVGRGLELVLTLGTGAGTALFRDGALMPHLELAQHPIHRKQTYNDYIGNDALLSKGVKKWSRRVHKTIGILYSLLHYDALYIGGGNAEKFLSPPEGVRIVSNQAGITGGIRLWDEGHQHTLPNPRVAESRVSRRRAILRIEKSENAGVKRG